MRIGTMTLLVVALLATGGCDQKTAAPGGAAAPAAPAAAAPAAAAKPAAEAAAPAAAASASGAASDVLAKAGSKTITRGDVEASVKSELGEVEAARYKIIRGGVDELVATALFEQEATARGVTVEQLQQTEVVDKVPAPNDDEVKKLYDENKDQLGGQSFDDVKQKLVDYMKNRGAQARYNAYIAELKKKYPTTIALRPPTVDVALGDAAAARPRRCEGDDRRVLRLRVPVLQARRGLGRPGEADLRRQDPHRLPQLSAALPQERAARGAGGAVRQ